MSNTGWRIGMAIPLLLLMSGCQAWTWTPEQRASHEAYENGFAACDKLTDFMDRKNCMDALPEDLTQIDPDEIVGVGVTGIDHLADHLSVQRFEVDGRPAGRADSGGGHSCCADLPRIWHAGLMVEVRWSVTNWRDCISERFVTRVPVEPYDQLGQMWVHFLADDSVRVVSSNWYPEGTGHPVKDRIPDKHPWDVYLYEACKGRWIERKAGA